MQRSLRFLLATLLLALPLRPAPVAAQTIAGWTLGADAEVGYFRPFRSLGKNGSGLIDLTALQTTADLDASLMFGGGIVAVSPSGTESLKLAFQTTSGGTVSGGLGVCGDEDDPLFVGELCVPISTDAEVRGVHAMLSFLRGGPGAFMRPEFHVGVGMRQYSFGDLNCQDPGEWQQVCEFTRDIWADSDGWGAYLTGGLGFQRQQGPLLFFVDGLTFVGRFPGGAEGIDAALQTDVQVSGGVSFIFR